MEHAALLAGHGENQFLFRFRAGRFGGLVFLVLLQSGVFGIIYIIK